MNNYSLSDMQKEYLRNATHRWNIKSGAVRSGKTVGDILAVIPQRIIERQNLPGLKFILGVSQATIERNVLEPMRAIYGNRIGVITPSKNTAQLFGQEIYCLGAEKISQVAKIQGASISYCYGDEVVKWNPEVFNMLKSRLDKPYSCFDGTCNPDNNKHWFKQFMDNPDLDIYVQRYRIFDNPFLDPEVVKELCKEYAGTIYYDRYIEGLWVRAEGAIYKKFANDPDRFKTEVKKNEVNDITIGIDFGGNGSGHAFVATGIEGAYENLIALASKRIMQKDYPEDIDANVLNKEVEDFVRFVQGKYGPVETLYYDNAEVLLGNGLRTHLEAKFPGIIVRGAKKDKINDRINALVRLMGAERFYITDDCGDLEAALCEAVWNPKAAKDERLDDGSVDIDTLDAHEYSWEQKVKYLFYD